MRYAGLSAVRCVVKSSLYLSKEPTGIQMSKLENEEDNWMISILLKDKSKLKRFIFILGGLVVLSIVVIILMATFLIDDRNNNSHDNCGTSAQTQDKNLACSSSPCFNGGQCINTNDIGYNCSCPDGFSGPRCEETPCDNVICFNGGLCQVQNISYSCVCRFGFFGDICQFDPCKKSPCLNGGVCEINRPDYTCTCHKGYTGKNCQVTPCDIVTCLNGGNCTVNDNMAQCKCTDDFVGHLCQEKGYKDYLIMFTEAPRSDNNPYLLVWTAKSTELNITALNGGGKRTVDLHFGTRNSISFSKTLFTTDQLVERKGVRVSTNVAIKVFGYIGSVAGDGFMAIPTEILGKEYVVMMYKPYKAKDLRKALFGIVSKNNNTNINITIKTTDTGLYYNSIKYQTGDVIHLTLQELNTFQLSHTADLSGTTIKSDKPIAVFAGNKCNSILEYYCNAFLEMMLPNTQADFIFIIPTIERRDQFYVRVYCHDDTNILITTNNSTQLQVIKKGNFYEYISPHMSIINASKPVSVYGFPKDIPDYDAYMTTFYGIRQWKSDFMFNCPDNSLTNHISVVFKGSNDDTRGFILDYKNIHPAGTDTFTETLNGTTYVTFRFRTSSGAHSIYHTSNIEFGLWVYGEKSREGYGYPGGMKYLENP